MPASRIVSKILKGVATNSINPGIAIELVSMFEVDKHTAKKDGWWAVVKADELVSVTVD